MFINYKNDRKYNFINYKNETEKKLYFYRPFEDYVLTTSGYKPYSRPDHRGVDLVPINKKKNIYSIGLGTVVRIHPVSEGDPGGNIVVVRSNWYKNIEIKYMHLALINVQVGEKVGHKTILGVMGNTGHSTGEHLHLEIWYKGKDIDPNGNKVQWIERV